MYVSTASISSSTVFSHCGFAVQRAQRRNPNHRQIVARELIARQQFAHFEFDQIEQFRIVHHVDLVHRDHDVRHTHLAGQQNVLARLRHGAVGGGDDQNRAIHLRRARDHVLDVIGVAGAIDVRVVPLRRLVFHVRGRDRDSARLFFRRVVDRIERAERHLRIVLRQHLRDRRRQRRLAVIDMPDRPDIDVRLAAVKFFFSHAHQSPLKLLLLSNFALNPRHNLFRDILRHFFITREVHRETAAALRARTQLGRITEHFAQRHAGLDDLRRAAESPCLPAGRGGKSDVAVHRAHIFFRHHHFNRHHRLEQHRLRLAAALPSRRSKLQILNAISDESTS